MTHFSAASGRIAKTVAAVIFTTVLAMTAAACGGSAQDVPRVFGLSSEGPGSGVDAALATAQTLDRPLDVINFFEAWAWEQPLDVDVLHKIDDAGVMPAVTWEPWNPQNGPTATEFRPSRIAAGEFDDYIRSWADSAAEFGKPMQIRFGHEMNGTWYPWAVGVGGNTAADFVAAYRHVHDIFMSSGATKVQWVWSFDSSSRRDGALDTAASTYPGDTYVDLIGIDGYNGGAAGEFWQSPQDLFGRAIDMADRVGSGKPVWIYETGSGDELGDKAQWIRDLFSYLSSTSVRGVLWFDFSKSGEANWLLDSSDQTLSAAKEALASW
ncbi:glycoside hydrolase family 26 protein [Actinomycetes bacterium M1A6_2h]